MIAKIEATQSDVKITLESGVKVLISDNHGYLHLHFSGIGTGQIVCTPMSALDDSPKQELVCSNFVNVFYPQKAK